MFDISTSTIIIINNNRYNWRRQLNIEQKRINE